MIKLYPIAKQILREAGSIAKINKSFTITYDLTMTNHAEERQLRHIDSTGEVISDNEIKALIEIALPDLTYAMIKNKVDIGDRLVLVQGNLHIVGQLQTTNGKDVKFIVITVMKEKDFRLSKDNIIFRY